MEHKIGVHQLEMADTSTLTARINWVVIVVPMKTGFIDKLIERMDRIDPGSLQTYFLRLVQEKGLLETIFQAIREGILVLDDKGRVAYANASAAKMLGFRLESVQGQPAGRLIPDPDWRRLLDLEAEEWSRMVKREIEIQYPEHAFLEFYLVPLQAVSNKEKGGVVIFRDVTREHQHHESTLESERLNAIMLLAAGVAHEIGNPLNAITIHLQLMERELRELPGEKGTALSELLQVARDEVSRLDHILTDFLGAIRPSDPQREQASVEVLLTESLRVLRKEAEDRGAWIEVDVPPDLPVILVDKGQVRQAFFNLARNAIQSMGRGGILKVTASSNDRFVLVCFRDSGDGISAEALAQIFEPYRSSRLKGTGLGLMIVQRILRDHGGHIEIDTEPGRGTAVTMYLPREGQRIRLLGSPAPVHPPAPLQPAPSTSHSTPRKKRQRPAQDVFRPEIKPPQS